MERKEFLKRMGMGSLILPLVNACDKEEVVPDANDPCHTTPSETDGPFPTKSPSSLTMVDITSDRTGVALTIKITIQNKNTDCSALEGAQVDIWHCDKDGYYSEYGGTPLQPENLTAFHFLRGRQSTDSDGLAAFSSIFPGWYPGRAPHIHVHVHDSIGNSLLITQIAFPIEVCNAVYTTATQHYINGEQDTSNGADNVFADSLEDEMSNVTGNVNDGYVMSHTIVVDA